MEHLSYLFVNFEKVGRGYTNKVRQPYEGRRP